MIRNYTTIDITNESESIINITKEMIYPSTILSTRQITTIIVVIIVKGYKQ
jgi:hypothetical protein